MELSLSLLIAGMSVNAGDLIAQYHLGISEQINTCLRHKIECKYPARVLQEKEREKEKENKRHNSDYKTLPLNCGSSDITLCQQ